MTPDDITRALYNWLLAASRVDELPMGSRPATWDEVRDRDPDLAAKWRLGVDLFLTAIEAEDGGDDDPHLKFIASPMPPPRMAGEDDPGAEHTITPDGG
jgi:hypothetical protein